MSNSKRLLTIILALVCVAITAVFLSRPFLDADFFWHLKTGEWMWQHKSLMTSDQFTLPPLPEQTPRSQFVMTSYWLSQLILYAFYAVAGLPGIVLYRWLIAGIILFGISRWTSLKNWGVIATIGTFWILAIDSFFLERPHFLSFIFLGGVLIILFRFLENPDKYSCKQLTLPLSILMLLWGNMHGGFLVGQAMLLFIILTEGVKFLFPNLLNPLQPKEYKKLVGASLGAIAASLINPNPVNSIKMFFSVGETNNFIYTTNFEYASVFQFITLNHNRVAILFVISVALTALFFISSRQRSNITWLGILLITGYMGLKHVRYIPFFFVAATLFSSRAFDTGQLRTAHKAVIVLFFIITTGYCLNDEPRQLKMLARYGLVSAKEYPVNAADFIEKNRLQGNLFNDFNWGGYLIWRFGTNVKTFSDGRLLYPSRYWEWLTASSVTMRGKEPEWKNLFDRYSIQTVLLPLFGKNGEPFPLTSSIRSDKDWIMVFAKSNAAVFRRISPQTIAER